MFCYKKIILVFSIFIFFLGSCKTPPSPQKDFTKLSWLLGTWDINKGSEYETWYQLNDSTFFGRNFRVYHETDTIVTRNMKLIKKENEIFYAPTIKTPNGDKVVNYKMISDSDGYFVFETTKHSFPKKISYTRINNSTAKTLLEDEKRKIEYNYKKLK